MVWDATFPKFDRQIVAVPCTHWKQPLKKKSKQRVIAELDGRHVGHQNIDTWMLRKLKDLRPTKTHPVVL